MTKAKKFQATQEAEFMKKIKAAQKDGEKSMKKADEVMNRSKSAYQIQQIKKIQSKISQDIELLTNFEGSKINEGQNPDKNLFIKSEFKQDKILCFKNNNYALDLIKPNHNLKQYQRREQ